MSLNIDSDRLPDVWGHESYIETSGWDACHSSQKERQLVEIPWQWSSGGTLMAYIIPVVQIASSPRIYQL
jgi:hypothetical protein